VGIGEPGEGTKGKKITGGRKEGSKDVP
jgi:hypothetical protein